jgi:hypothetical protein
MPRWPTIVRREMASIFVHCQDQDRTLMPVESRELPKPSKFPSSIREAIDTRHIDLNADF